LQTDTIAHDHAFAIYIEIMQYALYITHMLTVVDSQSVQLVFLAAFY